MFLRGHTQLLEGVLPNLKPEQGLKGQFTPKLEKVCFRGTLVLSMHLAIGQKNVRLHSEKMGVKDILSVVFKPRERVMF